jgi:imidazoleglycerol-phosphate dehydratase
MRSAHDVRKTKESAVSISLALDAPAQVRVDTGIRMFDHLLEQWAFHARVALDVDARSLDGIVHHLVEDAAIALGCTLSQALGSRAGIARYGCVTLPMDDALVRCSLDFGGRAFARVDLALRRECIEDLPVDLVRHFFASFAANVPAALHVDRLSGEDEHHIVEAAFKALARACRAAWTLDPAFTGAISTKELV